MKGVSIARLLIFLLVTVGSACADVSLFNFFWFSPIFQGKPQIPMKFCRLYLLAFDKSIVLHRFSCISR